MGRGLVRHLESSGRVLRATLTAPPFVGAVYVLGLAAWAGRRGAGDDAELGDLRRAEAVEAFIAHRFGAEIDRMKVAIAAMAVGLGLLVGIVAWALIRLRRARPRRGRRPWGGAFAEALVACAAVHAFIVLWAMADSPQLYAARWYAEGGAARTVQVVATDVLGTGGVAALALALALAYVRPRSLVYALRRGASIVWKPARSLRAWAIRGALLVGLGVLLLHAPQDLPPRAAVAAEPDRSPKGPRTRASVTQREPPAGAAPAGASPSGPARGAPAGLSSPPMNVLFLAADSLRADRLDPRVAPHLSRLADHGTRFDRAYVSIPRTFPSWVTILTGRHAHHHGVRSMFPTWEDRARDFDAVPARLARAGYATGVVGDYAGDIFGRIDLGFARVDTPSFDFRQLIRQRALERETPLLPLLHSRLGRRLFPVMRELSDAADPRLLAGDVERALVAMKDGPFFLTAFFSTAHFPYAAPGPYYAKYTDPAYRGRFKYKKPVGLGQEAPPDADDVRQIRALYDGAVSAIDDAMGRVLETLARLGLAERTIVVVTADHGETLYDHGHGQGHGDHLFGDEGTHVPLIVYDPRAKAGAPRVSRVVRDVDIAPTLYELLGLAPPSDVDGRSLAGALRGEDVGPRFAYAETELWFTEEIPQLPADLRLPYPGVMALTELDTRHNAEIVLRQEVSGLTTMARHRMIRDERYKLVYVPTRRGPRYMLFDVVADPAELHDVSAAHPAEVIRLRGELWAWMLSDPKMVERDGVLVPRVAAPRAREAAR